MSDTPVKAYTITATCANREWSQLLFVYNQHIAFCGREEAVEALHRMHFGVRHAVIDELIFLGPGIPIHSTGEQLLSQLYGHIQTTLPQYWVQAAFEYIVFGKVEAPAKMPRLSPWDATVFQHAVAEFQIKYAELIEALWKEVGAAATASDEAAMA